MSKPERLRIDIVGFEAVFIYEHNLLKQCCESVAQYVLLLRYSALATLLEPGLNLSLSLTRAQARAGRDSGRSIFYYIHSRP